MDAVDSILADAGAFMRSRIILAAAELDLFSRLHECPAPAADLAIATGLHERALTRVLDCLIVLGLLVKQDGRYTLTERGLLLSERHPESVLPMVLHYNMIWHNWSSLSDAVREGRNPRLRPVVDAEDPQETQAFIGAMHVVGRHLARELAGYCDVSSFGRLLDIGGGSGTYTIAFLRENPQLRAVLFDLPGVLPMAEARLHSAGLRDRVTLVAGDFSRDELPGGCDLALLSAIVHQNSVEENIALLRKIHRALLPGGALIIRDHVMDDTRTKPPGGALFALNMLVSTRAGDTYTLEVLQGMLETANFQHVRLLRAGESMDGLVEAWKARE